MDKLTSIRIKYSDGTYLDEVPIGVLAQNVGYDSGHNLIQVLGSVDVESNGTIQQQINRLFNEKLNSSDLSSYVNSKITTDVSKWLADNVTPVGSTVMVDQSLSISGAAADSQKTGDIKNDLEVEILRFSNLQKNKLLLPGKFKLGNIYGSGSESNIKYRIVSKQFISLDERVEYQINPGFRVKIGRYNKITQQIHSLSDWLTGSFYLTSSYLFKVIIAREEQNVNEIADLPFFLDQVYRDYFDKTLTMENVPTDAKTIGEKQDQLSDRITNLEKKQNELNQYIIQTSLFPSIFKNGSINDNGEDIDNLDYRIYSSDFVTFNEQTIYIIKSSYKIQVYKYNTTNNTFIEKSDWIKNFYIFHSDYIYKIVIARVQEDTTQVADVSLFFKQVYQLFPYSSLITDNSFKTTYLGTAANPYGWTTGYFNDSGSIGASSRRIRTVTSKYRPDQGIKAFTVNVASGYTVSVLELNQNGQVVKLYGSSLPSSSATSQLLIIPSPGYAYAFTIGGFEEDVSLDLLKSDGDFINSLISITAYRDKECEFIKKQKRDKHLNILIFGNSYSGDSWGYVPFLLKKYGITVNIYIYYRGSGSINRLLAEWEDRSNSGLDPFGRSHVRRMAHIDTRYSPNTWDTSVVAGYCAKDVLEFVNDSNKGIDKWDIISLQEGGRQQHLTEAPGGGDPRDGIQPFLRKVINLIRQSYNKNYSLAWFESYTAKKAYDGDVSKGYPPLSAEEGDDRIGILKATETIFKAEPFDLIIPSGAAVFNGRTNAELASINVSAVGNLWCPDVVHLDAGIPSYISACTVVESIFRKFFPNLSILGDDTRITDELIANWHCPFVGSWQGPVKTVDEKLYHLAQKCAINACNNPFDFTPIYSPDDTTELAMFDTHSNRYWADSLIDTSHIINGQYVE